jgi:hypothetical protein
MTEPSEYARSVAVQFFGHPEHGALREALAQVVDAVRAVVRRDTLMDAATALHDLPTPQVGQHPECIVLALIEREDALAAPPERNETPLHAPSIHRVQDNTYVREPSEAEVEAACARLSLSGNGVSSELARKVLLAAAKVRAGR